MLDLAYPLIPTPVLPVSRHRGTSDETSVKACEYLPIVEPSGLVVAQASRLYVHGGSKLLHPVVHLHIMDRSCRLFIQKRSSNKDLLPGRWDTAVGGHIGYGEQAVEALFREAGEELGLYDFNPVFLKSYINETDVERELVFVFATVGNFELNVDNYEVEDGRWWTYAQISNSMGKDIFTPNFELEFTDIKDSLQALL